jgi:eukaryotic-like serine/threonine-protein kinase
VVTPRADVHPPISGCDPLAGTAYRALGPLGRGTMGQVFEAEHAAFGRVVVKLLHAELADRPDLIDRMRLEAEVLARLNHPNIVRFLEFGVTLEGRPFLALERLVGDTLRAELAARGRLSVAEAIDIAHQTLEGLAATHAVGILHRDIKPANLFLLAPVGVGPKGVKILDFGVAKVIAQRGAGPGGPAPLLVPTAPGMTIGTPRFLSPEQIRGRPLDPRTDLYAVGLVLYTMLVGKGPFDDISDLAQMMRAHLDLIPPLPSGYVPGVPRRLDRIIMKALAKRPEDRFGSAAELLAELKFKETSAPGSPRGPAGAVAGLTTPLPPLRACRGEGMTIPLPPASSVRSWDGEGRSSPAEALDATLTSRPAVDSTPPEDRTTLFQVVPERARRRVVEVRLVIAAALCIIAVVLVAWFSAEGWGIR